MSFIKTKDGTEIYYKDWGEGPVVTFSRGRPLNSDMWDGQMPSTCAIASRALLACNASSRRARRGSALSCSNVTRASSLRQRRGFDLATDRNEEVELRKSFQKAGAEPSHAVATSR